ncbi:MAG: PTS sugar transporter subunit IIB [Firmicutes bacterium]|jgi:PTS system ascorbate-specific IIB component|nr:PTS sugar transporter subunit IIB [Bacillota bacterium]
MPKELRIATICGMGFGTSLILKYGVDDVLAEAGITGCTVEACDLGSAKASHTDLIVAADDMRALLDGAKQRVVYLHSMTNKKEMREKVLPVVRELLGS